MYKGSDDYYMLFHKIQTNAIKRERIERIQVLYLAYIIYVHVPTWCKTSLYTVQKYTLKLKCNTYICNRI